MHQRDWPEVERIYREGIDSGAATFEAESPTWAQFDAHRSHEHRLVAVDHAEKALGWAAVAPVSSRAVYAGVVEHSVYVGAAAAGRGIGSALLEALIASTEAAGIWTIQGVVFPENHASLALHDRFGFRVVGRRERIAAALAGPQAGVWRDTLLIERRAGSIDHSDVETPTPPHI
ncbi:N-acetyltransferase family protein [Clavibacter zhangzhiyongii]|uniref:N-acetyltransferase family protein n=2 Tax=Clavibacter zhangzhiyongii TaxID=2768071 RepID=A0A7L7Z660_9MICO|nr:N-acetyltransferase family protein [Clavibacter zhangzhiyongii]